MSHLLYSKRVYWDGRKGGVTVGGVYRNLTMPPVFRGIEEIDYAPETGCAQVRPATEKMREMTSEEISLTEAYMRAVQYGGPVMHLRDLVAHAG